MVAKSKEIADDAPAILTGGFNSTPETGQIQAIQTLFRDAHTVTKTPPHGQQGTFNSFKFDAPMDKRIDYIFLSKPFNMLKYGILTDAKDQRYPSDHQPVMTKPVLN
jgi:endonuclease/exonuclease/phosphatase family metal-dependent hydrolase